MRENGLRGGIYPSRIDNGKNEGKWVENESLPFNRMLKFIKIILQYLDC